MGILLNHPHHPRTLRPARPAPSPRQQLLLPEDYRRLDVRCHGQAHAPLQARMAFSGWSRTPAGDPLALYACPVCGQAEAWGADHRTGQPRRITRLSAQAR